MRVEVKVQHVKGACSAGYQAGHTFFVQDPVIIGNGDTPLCFYAISAMLPYLAAFCRKTGEDDWINSLKELQCPDCKNAVTFALKRIR